MIYRHAPELNGVARYQATYQEVISTQLHDMVIVRDEWVREMVILMDGSSLNGGRDRREQGWHHMQTR